MSTLGLYIHVPFCAQKCPYCSFYSSSYSRANAEDYTRAVVRNIRHYCDTSRTVDTVYFGGGTPSLLSAAQLGEILSAAAESFYIAENAELTLEANPSTLTPSRLAEMRRLGINRLSIGVQSMNDDELQFLGRRHSAQRAERAVLDAHEVGFENISCDLMAALPGQTPQKLKSSIEQLCALPIRHISAYLLKIEENTPFDRAGLRDLMPSEDESAELYLEMVAELEKRGFMQYEVSNFAVPGFESRHNCRYWKCSDYLGIGPSAHSCCGGKRFAAECSIEEFINSDVQPTVTTDEAPCGEEEQIMLRLRLKEGLRPDDFPLHAQTIKKKLTPLINADYASFQNDILSLTPKGFLMSNQIIGFLLSGE